MELVSRTARLLLISTTIISFIIPTTASLTHPKYYAYGSIDHYQDTFTAEIIWGYWYVRAQENQATVDIFYMERNLVDYWENSPNNTIDMFHFQILTNNYLLERDTFTCSGTSHSTKKWARMSGAYEIVENYIYHEPENGIIVEVMCNSDTFYHHTTSGTDWVYAQAERLPNIDINGPYGMALLMQDWRKVGTTKYIGGTWFEN